MPEVLSSPSESPTFHPIFFNIAAPMFVPISRGMFVDAAGTIGGVVMLLLLLLLMPLLLLLRRVECCLDGGFVRRIDEEDEYIAFGAAEGPFCSC